MIPTTPDLAELRHLPDGTGPLWTAAYLSQRAGR